jgi:hypothetical protein
MKREFNKGLRVMGLVYTSVLVSACSDTVETPSAPASPPVSARASALGTKSMLNRFGTPQVSATAKTSIDSIARNMAMRLARTTERGQLVRSLRASTADEEHKLLLMQAEVGMLRGPAAAMSLRAKARAPHTRDFTDLGGEMEVYMPVRAHREAYTGQQPLLVAWQVDEDEAPVAYNAKGERIVLSLDTPPQAPVLMIVPKEGDLEQIRLTPNCKNAAAATSAIGTWSCKQAVMHGPSERVGAGLPSESASAQLGGSPRSLIGECDPNAIICEEDPDNPPPPSYTPPPAGFYLTEAFLTDLHEPWPRGTPEITYYITTVPTFGNANDTRVSCLSESPLPNTQFFLDQNTGTQSFPILWYLPQNMYTNQVQINDMEAIAASRGMATADVKVTVWEDDYGSKCSLDEGVVWAKIQAAVTAVSGIVGTVKGFNKCFAGLDDNIPDLSGASKRFKSVTSICGLLKIPGQLQTAISVFGGDDDFIGVGSEATSVSANQGYSHVIVAQSGLVGRYNITGVNAQ